MGSETVTIGGREFRVGATYAPRAGKSGNLRRVTGELKNHVVRVIRVGGRKNASEWAGVDWFADWAGEEVAQP